MIIGIFFINKCFSQEPAVQKHSTLELCNKEEAFDNAKSNQFRFNIFFL